MRWQTKQNIMTAVYGALGALVMVFGSLALLHYVNPSVWDVSETVCFQKGSIELYHYGLKKDQRRFYLPADQGWVRVEDKYGNLLDRFKGSCTTRTTVAVWMDPRFENFDNVEYLDI